MLGAMLGGLALDYMKQQTANRERKRQAAAGMLQSDASHYGAPTYNVQAARTLRDNRLANQQLFQGLADRGARSAMAGAFAPSAEEQVPGQAAQQYVDAQKYAGSKMGQGPSDGGYPAHLRPGWNGQSAYGDATGELTGNLARSNNAITGGYKNEDDALASIGVY